MCRRTPSRPTHYDLHVVSGRPRSSLSSHLCAANRRSSRRIFRRQNLRSDRRKFAWKRSRRFVWKCQVDAGHRLCFCQSFVDVEWQSPSCLHRHRGCVTRSPPRWATLQLAAIFGVPAVLPVRTKRAARCRYSSDSAVFEIVVVNVRPPDVFRSNNTHRLPHAYFA